MKRRIKIKCQNGLLFHTAIYDILNVVADKFDFVESDNPEYIFFGPYGNDVPEPGPYVRIGYFCENIIPDLNSCDWAFGIPSEQQINNPKYKRIQWHNLNPDDLVKKDWDVERILASKTKFCNFFYSHPVPYREEFFRQLSKYKKVDAPGKSMNNMPSVDNIYKGGKWEVKHQFLTQYKFTIAFENYVYPHYQTEKLYDAMLCQSLPVYCGDPNISEIFNTQSFLFANDFIRPNNSRLVKFLENRSQLNFTDIRPLYYKSANDRIRRKLKSIGKNLKMKLQFNKLDFSDLIDQIIMLDKDPDKYVAYLRQPWFHNNTPPANFSLRDRWIEIFSNKS
ncbi:glycosyltransferase family 10 domain-containing protein [Mucilaginibacter sp. OK098]|uniref:glycosyltransferase family 10 domain-containing protein n=1 Tax=Mucilaginibacter sp. OK098 TaxID=1855297 RepID=UPI0009325BF9|nr:glycosyltransferase family 10 [Mucilaginibacter sp. OK098]